MNEKIVLHVEVDGVMHEDITLSPLQERWDVKDEKNSYTSGHIFTADHKMAPYTFGISIARNKTSDEKESHGESQIVTEE